MKTVYSSVLSKLLISSLLIFPAQSFGKKGSTSATKAAATPVQSAPAVGTTVLPDGRTQIVHPSGVIERYQAVPGTAVADPAEIVVPPENIVTITGTRKPLEIPMPDVKADLQKTISELPPVKLEQPAPKANLKSGEGLDGISVAPSAAAAKVNGELTAANNPSGVEREMVCESIDGIGAPFVERSINIVLKSCQPLKEVDKSCFGVFQHTNKWCHTEENASISESITMIQTLMSVAQGVTNACNNFGKAMDIAKKAMTLYTTACTAAQVACNSKCGGALKKLTEFTGSLKESRAALAEDCKAEQERLIAIAEKTAGTPAYPAAVATAKVQIAEVANICQIQAKKIIPFETIAKKELAPEGNLPGIASKAKICKVSIPAILGTAIVNLGALAQSKAQSDQCKADTEAKKAEEIAKNSCDNVANKDRADCACNLPANKDRSYCPKDLTVDCGKSENTEKPICICKANPRLAGCEGMSTALATNSTLNTGKGGGLTSSRGPSSKLPTAPGGAAPDANGLFPNGKDSNRNDGGGVGSNGGGGGSSAGLSGSSGGGDSKDAAAGADGLSKDSANILDSGGGGGGGGFRSGFGGYNSPDYNSRLKAYASKNGIGKKMAGNSWSAQVTPLGGRSNFEKVKVRYLENQSSLLGR
jgi:hypothetical protein